MEGKDDNNSFISYSDLSKSRLLNQIKHLTQKNTYNTEVIEKLEQLGSDKPSQFIINSLLISPISNFFTFVMAVDELSLDEVLDECTHFFIDFIEKNDPDQLNHIIEGTRDEKSNSKKPAANEKAGIYSMDIDPSVSMVVEQNYRHKDPREHIYYDLKPRALPTPSITDSDRQCTICKTLFSTLVRAHHCRICGCIICYECSIVDNIPSNYRTFNYYNSNYLTSYIRRGKEPICKICHPSILISSAFGKMGLTISCLIKVAKVCSDWRIAAIQTLSQLREIQYQLPHHTLNKQEKRMLWNNRNYWRGHDKWLVKFLRAVNWENSNNAEEALNILSSPSPTHTCWDVMCTSRCLKSNKTDMEYAIQLLFEDTKDDRVRQYAISCIEQAEIKEQKCYLRILVHCIRYETPFNSLTFNYLLKTAIIPEYQEFRTELYWALNMASFDMGYKSIFDYYMGIYLMSISQHMPIEAEQFVQGYHFASLCHQLNENEDAKVELAKTSHIILPLAPRLSVLKFHTENIERKDSATAPLLIPSTCTSRTPSSEPFTYKLLYKFEDIRKDQIVMDIIRLSQIILSKEGSPQVKKCKLVTYNILPTTIDSGFIEIVDASTFYDIQNRCANGGLYKYAMNENIKIDSGEYFETIARSAAAYSVVSLLLNVGDRHLDNIMLTKRGEFFHIDYGFILGEEPYLKKVMPSSLIRMPTLLTEVIQTIRERNNSEFDFIELSAEIYVTLRRHYVMFMNLLILLDASQPKIPFQFDSNHIEDEIHARFLPGRSDKDAKEIFIKIITNPESLFNSVTDFGHQLKRQHAFDRFKKAINYTYHWMFVPPEDSF